MHTPKPDALKALHDMLPNLQIDLIEAHLTQCRPDWRELDYVPAYSKLYFICEGEGWLKIGDREHRPKPGQLCLMPAHIRQSFSAIDGLPPFRKYWCHFTADVGSTGLFQWLETPGCLDVAEPERVTELFEALIACQRERSLSARLREKAALLELLAVVAERAAVRAGGRQAEDAERLSRIAAYIEERLHGPVTLEEIAKQVHLHPNYLIRYFKKHFGMTPLRYLNRKRMEKARFLLRATPFSIKEIAARTGFDDANHFAKAFRRESGSSPSAFRAKM
ncbi:AraC family transcriptional regulator [Cohnella zeiphila]|uniref:Helix-turn-helix transcriptional regulator n=1 Tax=Cohnella zeiphila TaxID=2761120 RepID=A0A7X0SUR2_9BACL|nr:AraC family transcriptional regulator [Cohnella zeiphila]MBB6735509.1 helix-turn-helix transcriptional regulator [Cohnella zeiphila]